ncbi:endonuclease III [Candidatus Marinamargulisbacteria bacterium SCGC AG-343-K17]|nr:endonuclease III [Candidatus Marinamargulisbacteria bacterium SCGC AG-343-K17]
MPESIKESIKRSVSIFDVLKSTYPPVTTFLTHKNDFELLIAVILSAQCTDARVNMVTPALFDHLPTPQAFVDAELDDIKELIKSINFFNNKAKNIQATAQVLLEVYNGQVPADLNKLVELPGVGRKTANVVLGQAFDIPGITVDTHVKRLSQRLGFTKNDDAVKAEMDLIKRWPEEIWIDMSSLLILHGRQICNARKPKCQECSISSLCPSFPIQKK